MESAPSGRAGCGSRPRPARSIPRPDRVVAVTRRCDDPAAGQVDSGRRIVRRRQPGDRPLVQHAAPRFAGARAEVDQPVGRSHHPRVVLDDDDRVAHVAQRDTRRRSAVRRPSGASRRTARPARTACPPATIRARAPAGFAGPRRRRAFARYVRASGSPGRRRPGTPTAAVSSERIGAAISRSVGREPRAVRPSRAARVIGNADTVGRCRRPATRTASASGRSFAPPHAAHGT